MAFVAPLIASAGFSAGLAGVPGAFALSNLAAGGLSGLSTIASVGGMFFNTLGSMRQNSADAAAASFNARQAEQNARIAEQQTAQEVEQQKREDYLRRGAIVARGGQGGSTLDILLDNAAQEELNILNIQHSGLLKRNAYTDEASLERAKAKNIKSTGKLSAAASLLSGGAKLGGLLA